MKSQGEENFEKFLLHALHLPSKKPRHKTHVILVAADLAWGMVNFIVSNPLLSSHWMLLLVSFNTGYLLKK